MNKEQNKIKFGCYIYQEGLEYEKIKQIVIECEKLGFESVWLKDNFGSWLNAYFSHRKKEEEGDDEEKRSEDYFLECWTTLSSIAAVTKRIRLGAILVNLHRSPSLTAKMVSTLDVISNGRIDFGLSAGWHRSEIESYGLLYPSKASIRIETLGESIQIIKKLISKDEDEASFKGKYYSITNARCKPAPVQKPWPRLWIGGGGEKTLKLVAKYGDGWIYGLCTYDTYIRKVSILNDLSGSINRDCGEIIKAWHGIICITDDEQVEIEQSKRFIVDELIGSSWKDNLDLVITGTPEHIIKEIKRYIDIGVSHIIIHFVDLPSLRSLRLFAKYVMPHFMN